MSREPAILAIPPDLLDKLHRRAMLAAEVPTSEPEMRAFVVVIPKVTVPEPTTHNLSPVLGYEVRYIRHHAKWIADYGHDDDKVMNERTTRARRVFVPRQPNEGALIAALRAWLSDLASLRRPHELNSAVVYQQSDYYFQRPEDFPHLWEE